MDQNLTQNVDTLFANLENFTQNEGLLGKPVTHGDKTFIPVVSVTMGYGSGNTATKGQQGSQGQSMNPASGIGNMAGGALGLGAKLSTEAIIIIDQDNVSMMQVSASSNTSQLIDKIPQMLSGMNPGKQQQGQQQNPAQGQQQNQAQGQ